MEGAISRRAVSGPTRHDHQDRQDKAKIKGDSVIIEVANGEGLQVQEHLRARSSINEKRFGQEQYKRGESV